MGADADRHADPTRLRRRRVGVVVLLALSTFVAPLVLAARPPIDGPAEATSAARRATPPTAPASTEPSVTTPPPTGPPPAPGRSLRFAGTGRDDIDRVKIPLGPGTPVNVGASDLTIEFWIRGAVADNAAAGCGTGDAAWITGNVVVDRDVYGGGDRGDFGISLFAGRVAWGVSRGDDGATVCGTTNVLDGQWHHVAVTRRASDGRLQLWVDGRLDASRATSPATGDISYRTGRDTAYPDSDPFLVLGAEKHDAGAAYPSFAGWLDDLRISTVVRYDAPFTRPSTPHAPDASTAGLYRFDESTGLAVEDAIGSSPGVLRVGGPAAAPQRSDETPFG